MDKGKARKKKILTKLPTPKGDYSVVKFLEDASKLFECLPDNWFVDENKDSCFWPPKGKSVTYRAMNYEEPDPELWEIFNCILVSGGHPTYSCGAAIVREKTSQKYNTSSADEHLALSAFRRKHPGLISKEPKSFEELFVNADAAKNQIKEIELQNEPISDQMTEEDNVQTVEKQVESNSLSAATAASMPQIASPAKRNSRSDRPPVNSICSGFISASLGSRSRSSYRRSRSRSSRLGSGSSYSESRKSCSASRKSCSVSGSSHSESCRSRSGSRKYSASSKSSKSRSGSRSSQSSQSGSQTSCSRSRSSHSGKESSTRRRSKSRYQKSRSSSKSNCESHTRSNSRSTNQTRSRSDFRSSIRQTGSDSLNQSTSNGDWQSKFYSDTRLKLQETIAAKRHKQHGNTYSYERRLNEIPPDSELNVSSNDCTQRDLVNMINSVKKSIDENNRRLAENDRRLDRIEVVINKVFILVSHATRFNAPLDLTEIDADTNPHQFEVPKIPVLSIRELTVLNRKLKSRSFRSFLVGHQKEFCAPSTTTTDTVVYTAYLQKFISLSVRSSITLKEPKGKNGLTLFRDFRHVYLYLIDVVKAGYQLNKKTITTDQCHVALRIVWGRSNQLLKNQDKRRHRKVKHHKKQRRNDDKRHEKSSRRRK